MPLCFIAGFVTCGGGASFEQAARARSEIAMNAGSKARTAGTPKRGVVWVCMSVGCRPWPRDAEIPREAHAPGKDRIAARAKEKTSGPTRTSPPDRRLPDDRPRVSMDHFAGTESDDSIHAREPIRASARVAPQNTKPLLILHEEVWMSGFLGREWPQRAKHTAKFGESERLSGHP